MLIFCLMFGPTCFWSPFHQNTDLEAWAFTPKTFQESQHDRAANTWKAVVGKLCYFPVLADQRGAVTLQYFEFSGMWVILCARGIRLWHSECVPMSGGGVHLPIFSLCSCSTSRSPEPEDIFGKDCFFLFLPHSGNHYKTAEVPFED